MTKLHTSTRGGGCVRGLRKPGVVVVELPPPYGPQLILSEAAAHRLSEQLLDGLVELNEKFDRQYEALFCGPGKGLVRLRRRP
jgi:hypothetical protein